VNRNLPKAFYSSIT